MEINTVPTLNVKIADTPEQQAKGLMFVKSLGQKEGMLFVFGSVQKLSFWGENTYLPLDIAFVDERNSIVKIDRIDPLSRRAVSSGLPCKYAIEANVGFFNSNGIRVGDRIIINKKDSFILFAKRNSKESTKSVRLAQSLPDDIANQFPTLSDYFDHYDAQQSQQPMKQEDPNLPVLSPDEIGQYLEDSIEEQKDMQEQEGLPQEEPPLPEELEPQNVEDLEERIPRFSNISDAFNWGQENKEVMKISYQTTSKRKGTRMFGNNMITRYIEPHGRFTSHPDSEPSREVLVTFDETVGGIRAFRMQNIKTFSFVGRTFKPKFVVR